VESHDAKSDTTIPPRNPLPLQSGEAEELDAAISQIAKLGKRRGISSASMRLAMDDLALCERIDVLLSETLVSLRKAVPDDTAEKLFDRLSRVLDTWENKDEQDVLGIVFIRFSGTMLYMVAYKQKFRGSTMYSSISKTDALAELKIRGLTKR